MFTVLAIVLNSTVIVVLLINKQLRQPLNYSLVNMAVADLGTALTGGILSVVNNALGYFSPGGTGCVMEGFSVALFGLYNGLNRSGAAAKAEAKARMVVLMVVTFLIRWLVYATLALLVVPDLDAHISPLLGTVYLAKSSTLAVQLSHLTLHEQTVLEIPLLWAFWGGGVRDADHHRHHGNHQQQSLPQLNAYRLTDTSNH